MSLLVYGIEFCRFALLFTFIFSAAGKLKSIPEFKKAIKGFAILHGWQNDVAMYLILAIEFVIIILLAIAGSLLILGFVVAVSLLLLFTIALTSVLIRRIQTTCDCFGHTDRMVSAYDIIRNFLLILIGLVGWLLNNLLSTIAISELGPLEYGLLGIASATLILMLVNLRELAQLILGARTSR